MPFNFNVPQFTEVEDKVVGPLSFRQFVYVLGGVGAAFVLWEFLPNFIAILLIVPVGLLAAALAFYKVNKRPFAIILGSAIKYSVSDKLYLWKRTEKKKKKAEEEKKEATQIETSKLSPGKLRDIAWSLDVDRNIK